MHNRDDDKNAPQSPATKNESAATIKTIDNSYSANDYAAALQQSDDPYQAYRQALEAPVVVAPNATISQQANAVVSPQTSHNQQQIDPYEYLSALQGVNYKAVEPAQYQAYKQALEAPVTPAAQAKKPASAPKEHSHQSQRQHKGRNNSYSTGRQGPLNIDQKKVNKILTTMAMIEALEKRLFAKPCHFTKKEYPTAMKMYRALGDLLYHSLRSLYSKPNTRATRDLAASRKTVIRTMMELNKQMVDTKNPKSQLSSPPVRKRHS